MLPVVDVGAAIGKCRVTPHNIASTGVFAGFEQLRPADFVEPLRREPGQNELTLVIPNEDAVLVLHKKGRCEVTGLAANRCVALPNSLAGLGVKAPQLAHAAYSVNIITLPDRRAHHRVQTVVEAGAAGAMAVPDHPGAGRVIGDLE